MDRDLIDFLTKIDHCETPEEVYALWVKSIQHVGFEIVNYTYAHHQGDGLLKTSYLTNFSNGWMSHYLGEQYLDHDYLLDYMVEKIAAPIVHDFDNLPKYADDTKIKRDYLNGASEAGMHRALGVPFTDISGVGSGGVTIGSSILTQRDFQEILNEKGTTLFAIAHVAHQKLKHKYMSGNILGIYDLSGRQQEIIKCLALGLTNKEISHRLNITMPTVSFHLNAILKKLDLKSTREILPKAIALNLVAI